jgi:CRP/FNR family transcriptional regulator, cyclic AMP receptor protein
VQPEPDQLARVPLFASLSRDQLTAIATLTELRSEPGGARLVGEGAPGYSLLVLLDGTAAVTSGDEELRTLGPGDFFGEIALLTGEGRRTATVTSTTPVTLAVMLGSDYRVFARDWPEAAELIKQAVAERQRRGG